MISGDLRKSRMDWALLVSAALLLAVGSVSIASATMALPGHSRIVGTHFIALPLAALAFFTAWSLNYQIYQDQWKAVYALTLAALLAVLIFGIADRGSKSWFRLPFFSVQPSEICRIGLIAVLAGFLDRNSARVREAGVVLKTLALAAPVFILLMKQPDFSAVIITFPVVIAMLYCAGASPFHLWAILGYGFTAAFFPVLWTLISLNAGWSSGLAARSFLALAEPGFAPAAFCLAVAVFAWAAWRISNKFRAYIPQVYFILAAAVIIGGFVSGMWAHGQMKYYQRKRFEVFLKPASQPRGAGYNLLQAQIAIGSGGLLGKGFFSGTQSRLGFVPERHTDFILAVVGEETGFAGLSCLLALYLLVLRRVLSAAQTARDNYGYLLCCGIFSMLAVYLLINFGMSVGLLPVAGIPLPLVSYGGSNLVATLLALGLVESVYARRVAFA